MTLAGQPDDGMLLFRHNTMIEMMQFRNFGIPKRYWDRLVSLSGIFGIANCQIYIAVYHDAETRIATHALDFAS